MLFVGLHMGIGMTLQVGMFSFVPVVMLFAFLPRWFWDKCYSTLRKLHATEEITIIYFTIEEMTTGKMLRCFLEAFVVCDYKLTRKPLVNDIEGQRKEK